MRKYEGVVVFNPDLTEGQVKEEVGKIESFLLASGASQVSPNFWGKKEISYHVGKFKFGHFVCMNFQTPDADDVAAGQERKKTIELLTRQLTITDNVIKFQTQRVAQATRKVKVNPKKKDSGDDEFMSSDGDY